MDTNNEVVASISPEIAIDQRLPFYSGGLGVVEGDSARTAPKMGYNMVFVSLLAREGYYDQYIDENKMGIRYVRWEREQEFLDDTGILFPIEVNGKINWVKVWQIKDIFNTAPIYLLDTDIEQNDYLARLNTRRLYGGTCHSGLNTEELGKRKVAQFQILGQGAVEALRRLKYRPRKYHLNEGHCAFAALELLNRTLLESENMTLQEAVKHCKSKIVFTTHTPVPAGNESFDFSVVSQMMNLNGHGPLNVELLKILGGDPFGQFNLASCCMRLSGKANAVSQKHLGVAKDMWEGMDGIAPLIGITNGVDQDFWQYEDFKDADTPEKTAAAKLAHKSEVINKYAPWFDPNIALGCWGRRWAAYKRPQLFFRDAEWASNILKNGKLQLIIAGKPHPDDKDRIDDWNNLLKLSKSKDFPNLVLLPGYELGMMKELQGAADIWINTPRSPNEASGTSGMKANGAINLTIPDGWACEMEPTNGFLFGTYAPMSNIFTQDNADFEGLKEAVNNALTMHYFNRKDWNRKMLNSNRERMERWSMKRTLGAYFEKLYK
ncbi:hypothetical protein A3E06_03305 [Candidatus Giovannonibacteria bacterium RIFCSPHIGHO2_12_FULL_44_42]|nr:MAG: hypothetical protein A3E06_03305 [Candidatus Giovannonibacteria bacterium RIFCSPHIGHO2_12_FULL_44_42]OGF90280.1 MAG: hypothetical protein A3I94_01640 [Candidatus Giovannonibacteria bacterium RIFCSPLOWO2_02_FULL_43_54]